jgi:hypothetical protein
VDDSHEKVRAGTELDRLQNLEPDRYALFAEAIRNNAGVSKDPYLYYDASSNGSAGGASNSGVNTAASESESGGWFDWLPSFSNWEWPSGPWNRGFSNLPSLDAGIRVKMDGGDSEAQKYAQRMGNRNFGAQGIGNLGLGLWEGNVGFTATAIAPPAILMTERSSSPYVVGGGRSGFVSSPWWPMAAEAGIAAKVGAPFAAEGAGARGLGASPYTTNGDLVQSIATRADNWGIRQGLGNGPVAGTAKHGYAEKMLTRYQDMFGSRGLTPEARYVNNAPWQTGDPLAGSIRLDVVEGPLANPTHVWDYKFGQATLSQSRITQIQNGIPNGANVPILMVKP